MELWPAYKVHDLIQEHTCITLKLIPLCQCRGFWRTNQKLLPKMEFNTDMDAVSHKCLGKLQFYKLKFHQNRNNIPKMARCDCLWIRQSQLIIINFLWASENSKEVVSTLQPRLFKRWIGLSTI